MEEIGAELWGDSKILWLDVWYGTRCCGVGWIDGSGLCDSGQGRDGRGDVDIMDGG